MMQMHKKDSIKNLFLGGITDVNEETFIKKLKNVTSKFDRNVTYVFKDCSGSGSPKLDIGFHTNNYNLEIKDMRRLWLFCKMHPTDVQVKIGSINRPTEYSLSVIVALFTNNLVRYEKYVNLSKIVSFQEPKCTI